MNEGLVSDAHPEKGEGVWEVSSAAVTSGDVSELADGVTKGGETGLAQRMDPGSED